MGDLYLVKCKDFFVKGVIPAESIELKDEFYHELIAIYNQILLRNGLVEFASFLFEGHYLVQLWTAHIIIDRRHSEFVNKSLEIIQEYSENPLVPTVAKKEAEWIQRWEKENS